MTSTAPGTAPLPELVVRALGRVAVTGLIVGGVLVFLAIESKGRVDAAVVGVISTFLAIVTGATGALGAILASTRSVEPSPPGSVTVTPAAETEGGDPAAGVTVTAATTTTPPIVKRRRRN